MSRHPVLKMEIVKDTPCRHPVLKIEIVKDTRCSENEQCEIDLHTEAYQVVVRTRLLTGMDRDDQDRLHRPSAYTASHS